MKLIVLFPDSLPVNRITLPSDNGLFGCDPRVVPAFSYFSASPPVKKVDPESVDIPTALIPPARTLIPVRAVTIPTESTLVTSSYVIVPPTERLPPILALFTTAKPPKVARAPVWMPVQSKVLLALREPRIVVIPDT